MGKFLCKDMRRETFGNPTQLEPSLLPQTEEEVKKIVRSFQDRLLHLLDVGSCYNPFNEYKDFNVTAIDIAPAVGVSQCKVMINTLILP